jgi:hypothetical protein
VQIDARSLVPFDCRGVLASVAKTGRHPPAYPGSSRNGEEHDRCCKAIIETTLNIQDSSHPHRNNRVEHDGNASIRQNDSASGLASIGASRGESRADHDHDVWGRGLRAAMMQGCHPLSQHRNAGQGRGCAEVSGQWKRLEKRSLRRRGSSSLNWTFTHERLRMIHQRRRCGTLIRAIFSISSLVLDHALSPAFDVAKASHLARSELPAQR